MHINFFYHSTAILLFKVYILIYILCPATHILIHQGCQIHFVTWANVSHFDLMRAEPKSPFCPWKEI